ncbi:molecular chaperone [Dyella sp. C9]|uniref:fimbrial biogenesis chaperone n=1 Tax=Dyella sp. C9 TaxID=2202154 RepID=UPI000DEF1A91|nr:fimbria/pilus periplasmic chaperone [Dyella sp. C9]
MKILLRAATAALLTFCVFAPSAFANVVIGNTRVVFPGQDGETSVRLSNLNAYPTLVEAWIDDGDEHSTPDKVHTPFLITPPLFRMEPQKEQNLRIVSTQAQLPADRESLFWLNVLEIPPKPTSLELKDKNTLQFAFRSRIKLFYRPANLPGDPLKAPAQVTWAAVADGQGYALEAHNPTPYHVTIVKITVNTGGKQFISNAAGMVTPFANLKMPVEGMNLRPGAGAEVSYDAINDYGATVTLQGHIGQ